MSYSGGPEAPTGYGDPRDARARASAEKAYRKAQRPRYKKKRFIVPLAAVLLLVVVFSAPGGAGGRGSTGAPGAPVAQDPAAPPAFPGATSDDVVAQAGVGVDVDGLTVTTTVLTPGDDTIGETLCTTVSYANGTGSAAMFSLFDWKLQDPDGTILNTGLLGSRNLLSTGEIAPGGSASGDVCFDAPQGDTAGQYVVLLDPSFSFTSEWVAWLTTL